MANDLLIIKCDGCGAWKCLMKHMGAGLYTPDNGITDWLDAHGGCHPHAFSCDLDGVAGFSLHTYAAADPVADYPVHNLQVCAS